MCNCYCGKNYKEEEILFGIDKDKKERDIIINNSKNVLNNENKKNNEINENKNILINTREKEQNDTNLIKENNEKTLEELKKDANFLFPQHNILNPIYAIKCNNNELSVAEDKRTLVQFPYFNVISKITDGKECYNFIAFNEPFFLKTKKNKIGEYKCFENLEGINEQEIDYFDFKDEQSFKNFNGACEEFKTTFSSEEGSKFLRKNEILNTFEVNTTAAQDMILYKKYNDFFLNFSGLKIGPTDESQAKKILVELMDFFQSFQEQNKKQNKEQNKRKEHPEQPYNIYTDDFDGYFFSFPKKELKCNRTSRYILFNTNEGAIGVVFRRENDKIYAIICNHSKSTQIEKIKKKLNNCKFIDNVINLAKIQNDNEHCSVLTSIFFDEMYDFFENKSEDISDVIDEHNKSNKYNISFQEESKNIFDNENNNSNTGEIISPNNIKNENNKQIDISDEITKHFFPNLYKYRQKDVNKAEDIDKKYKGFLLQTDTYNILTDEDGNHKVYNLGLFRAGWERAIGCLIENLDDTPLFVLQTFIDVFEKQCKLFDEVIRKQLHYQHKEEELNNICTNEDYFNKKEIKEKIKQIKEEIKIRDKLKKNKKNSEQKICDKKFDFFLLCLVVDNKTKYITQYQYDYINKYKDYFGEIFYNIAKDKIPNDTTKIVNIMKDVKGKINNDIGVGLQNLEEKIKRKPPFTDNIVFGKKNDVKDNKKNKFSTTNDRISEFSDNGLMNVKVNKNLEKIKRERILNNKNFQ